MLFKEKIWIEDINKYGFVFHKYDHTFLKETDVENIVLLEKYVSSLISIPNEKLITDVDIINEGEGIDLHLHIVPGSFQVVVWVPDYKYEGREFLYGNPKDLKRFQPEIGMMCFMKPNDVEFVHGVSILKSKRPVKTYGITSSVFDSLPEVNDIFI